MKFHPIPRRQLAFVDAFCGNGGNATAAARVAGYSAPDVAGHRLLCRDLILGLILARVDACTVSDEVLRSLQSRISPAITGRIGMLLRDGVERPRIVGPADRPVVVYDADDAAVRDYLVRQSGCRTGCQADGDDISKACATAVSDHDGTGCLKRSGPEPKESDR